MDLSHLGLVAALKPMCKTLYVKKTFQFTVLLEDNITPCSTYRVQWSISHEMHRMNVAVAIRLHVIFSMNET